VCEVLEIVGSSTSMQLKPPPQLLIPPTNSCSPTVSKRPVAIVETQMSFFDARGDDSMQWLRCVMVLCTEIEFEGGRRNRSGFVLAWLTNL
jgi:hypothetical protein